MQWTPIVGIPDLSVPDPGMSIEWIKYKPKWSISTNEICMASLYKYSLFECGACKWPLDNSHLILTSVAESQRGAARLDIPAGVHP